MTTISGQVTTVADGLPVPGASIFLEDKETRTDDAGTYSIPDAPAGPAVMEVFAEGFDDQTRPVDVPASGTLTENFALVPDLLYGKSAEE